MSVTSTESRQLALATPTIISGVRLGLRLIIGGVFLYSGITKLWLPFEFLDAVYGYELVGRRTGYVVTSFLPWLEIIAGLSLLTGLAVSAGFLTSLLMLLFFVAVQAWAIAQGLNVACGCFGGGGTAAKSDMVGIVTLVRTSFLAAASAIGYALAVRAKA